MMEKLLKQMNTRKTIYELTLEQEIDLKRLLEKDKLEDGNPTDYGCECPRCGTALVKGCNFCYFCGQRARYIESDIVPL